MNYKVCILAAGTGLRMRPYTEHINKSLLPVNFKAAISHIIDKFNLKTEFVIAVGYLKETVIDYIQCAHKDRKITIVNIDKFTGKGSGPGYSLLKCRQHLKQPFIFYSADTIVEEKICPPTENWLGVAKVSNTEEYCTAKIKDNLISQLDDKVVCDNKYAFIGVAGVYDHELFFTALEKNNHLKNNELQVSNGFNYLINHGLKAKYFTWYDIGNFKGYLETNKKFSKSNLVFDFSKSDEFIYFIDNQVIKYFKDKKIIKNRYKRSKMLNGLCPKINTVSGSFYAYKKINGQVLYDVIDDNIMHRFLEWLNSKLWVKFNLSLSKQKKFRKDCIDFYYHKTISRVNEYHNKYSVSDQSYKINNTKVPSIKKLFDLIDWETLSCGLASNFHGDLQFDNILIKKNNQFIILDWRQDFSGNIEFGDQYYDLAKLNGGLNVSYKLIKQNKFEYNKSLSGNVMIKHKVPRSLTKAKSIYLNFLNESKLDLRKINILTGLIYLNMSPMHNEPFDHFLYNLGKLTLFKSLQINSKLI